MVLIQSQRMLGDSDGARANMALFLETYPESPQVLTYRDAMGR